MSKVIVENIFVALGMLAGIVAIFTFIRWVYFAEKAKRSTTYKLKKFMPFFFVYFIAEERFIGDGFQLRKRSVNSFGICILSLALIVCITIFGIELLNFIDHK